MHHFVRHNLNLYPLGRELRKGLGVEGDEEYTLHEFSNPSE